MERPAPALIGSVAVHAGVAAAVVAALAWGPAPTPAKPIANAVPVSIVSETVVEAAAADNPSEELVTDDAATAPVAAPPEPTPAPPEPTPPAPAPTPTPVNTAPTPRPTPPRPTPRPTPTPAPPKKTVTPPTPRPAPPRPAPQREASLDLDSLAGPARPAPRPGSRPATGQQGQGSASQAVGPAQMAAIFNKVYEEWNVFITCDMAGGADLRIQMDVTLSPSGRITAGPTLVGAQSSQVYRAASAEAMRALRASAPFDVPQGFQGGTFRPTFLTERACRGR